MRRAMRQNSSTPSTRPNDVSRRLAVTAKRNPSGTCAAQRSNWSSGGTR